MPRGFSTSKYVRIALEALVVKYIVISGYGITSKSFYFVKTYEFC
jgi:hypothetical protein